MFFSPYGLLNAAIRIEDYIWIGQDCPHKAWKIDQDVHTRLETTRKIYRIRKTVIRGIDNVWQLHSVSITISRYKSNLGYSLIAINVFPRFAFDKPIKKSIIVTRALETIIVEPNRMRSIIFVNKSSDVSNTHFTSLFSEKKNGIRSIDSEMEVVVTEWLNSALFPKPLECFTKTNRGPFTEVLPDLLSAYNSPNHCTVCMAPDNVLRMKNPCRRNCTQETHCHRLWTSKQHERKRCLAAPWTSGKSVVSGQIIIQNRRTPISIPASSCHPSHVRKA